MRAGWTVNEPWPVRESRIGENGLTVLRKKKTTQVAPAAQPAHPQVTKLAREISRRLRQMGDPIDAKFLQGFFKTGAGGYGKGDLFHGVRVPATRALLGEYRHAGLAEGAALLRSRWHEERLFALLLLVREYSRADRATKRAIYDF